MLHWKAIYIILTIVFGVLGFIGIGEGGIEPAKYISGMFLILLLTFYIIDYAYKKPKKQE